MTDYSQHGEQATILAWADGRHGSFLDLGSHDGATFSNTAALADLGWPGLCVDAAPDHVIACATRYRDRHDVDVLLAAFDHEGGREPALIHWTPGQMYSGLVASERDDVNIAPILVPRLDLAWLHMRVYAQPAPLFCSIDLEGESLHALAWLLRTGCASCICVEANNPGDRASVAELFDRVGWRQLDENPWNSVYARG